MLPAMSSKLLSIASLILSSKNFFVLIEIATSLWLILVVGNYLSVILATGSVGIVFELNLSLLLQTGQIKAYLIN